MVATTKEIIVRISLVATMNKQLVIFFFGGSDGIDIRSLTHCC
jgi:hypothetical protein